MKPTIYLDYDDTLVDFNSAILSVVNSWEKTNLTHSDIKSYSFLPDTYGHRVRELWQQQGLYKYVQPFPTSREFLNKLREHFLVKVVTKSHPAVMHEKEYHAKQHLGLRECFYHTDDLKARITRDGPLIDDAMHNIHPHVMENKQLGILFNMHGQNGWAPSTLPRHKLLKLAKSHDEVIALLGI